MVSSGVSVELEPRIGSLTCLERCLEASVPTAMVHSPARELWAENREMEKRDAVVPIMAIYAWW